MVNQRIPLVVACPTFDKIGFVGTEGAWELDLSLGGDLKDARGGLHRLPYRTAAELLAHLAEQAPSMVDRAALGRVLWPNASPPDRLTNLRQALAKLRRVLGEQAIRSTRSQCGLANHIAIKIVGRSESMRSLAPQDYEIPAATGYATMIEWLSMNDAQSMFSMIRANPELAFCSDQAVTEGIRTALRSSELKRNDQGWAFWWSGISSLGNDIVPALRSFSSASEVGLEFQDWSLFAHAEFWRGASLVLLNRVDSARAGADRAATILDQPYRRQHLSRIKSLQATVALHSGETEAALRQMQQLSRVEKPSRLDHVTDEALRALYLVFSGEPDAAAQILEEIEPFIRSVGRSRASAYAEVADLVIEVSGCGRNADSNLEAAAQRFKQAGQTQFAMYCHETLAKRLWDAGRRTAARTELRAAVGIRARLNLQYTKWDLSRFGGMQVALPS